MSRAQLQQKVGDIMCDVNSNRMTGTNVNNIMMCLLHISRYHTTCVGGTGDLQAKSQWLGA